MSDPSPSEQLTTDDVVAESRRWRALVERGSGIAATGKQHASARVERLRAERPVVAVGVEIYERDRAMAGSVVSSALAFRLFLFFVPLMLFSIGLAGVLSRPLTVDDVTSNTSVTGTVAQQIASAFSQRGSGRFVALALGLFGMVSTGRSLAKVMVAASALAWGLSVREARATVKVTGAVVGLIAGMGLSALLVERARDRFGLAGASASFFVAIALYSVMWLVVSTWLPGSTSDPGARLPGAALVGVVIVGLQASSQLFLTTRIGHAREIYGAIGAATITLGWFFFIARAMVTSLTVDAVLYERFGSLSQVVFGLPVIRALPARSARLRRWFDLDQAAS